jgi:hypothetical protein
MLCSANLAAKPLNGKGLTVGEAHSLADDGSETPDILWCTALLYLSSFLKI